MIRLKELIKNLDFLKLVNFQDTPIEGIAYDSRKVNPGFLFLCVKGLREDGHRFVGESVKRGAVAIVSEVPVENGNKIPQVIVKNSRSALSHISAVFYSDPSSKMHVAGITGTNGKTSTSFLCEAILKEVGRVCGVVGTISYRWGDRVLPANRTTPESLDIQEIMSEMFDAGCEFVLMEVSSHALEQDRVRDVDFRTGIFTNLSAEHLDYHGNLERYLRAKGKLFEKLGREATAIVNVDDPHGIDIMEFCSARKITYGIEREADVVASGVLGTPNGTSFIVSTPVGSCKMELKLLGKGNVYNAIAGVCFGMSLGIGLEDIKSAFEGLKSIRGRFEVIWRGNFTVVVDYAHTPQALELLLQSARNITPGRIITVFGCGGDRDKGKRPVMGEIAGLESDFSFITTDNPRSEEPGEIISQIEFGFKRVHKKNYKVITDRMEAIKEAISFAGEGDMVLIAGKGHETYQVFKDTVIPFDDREVVRKMFGN